MDTQTIDSRATGFAAPTQGYEEKCLDLNRLLIHNAPATYIMRLESCDMKNMGLLPGCLLIVDRSRPAAANSFVIIRHEGKFLCRRLIKENGKTFFTNGKEDLYPVPGETEIFGTVSASINIYGETFDISH